MSEAEMEMSPSQLIDAKIEGLGGWRGNTLTLVRKLIREADPAVVEAVKWRKPTNLLGVPVWEHAGIICTGETYKSAVKLTFARARRSRIPPVCSTPASTAICGAPSICMRMTTSMRRRSRR
jgi:hypothetical protein